MSLASPYQEHYYVADGVTTSFSFGEYFTGLSQAYVKCIIYFDDGTNCVPTFTVDMTTGFITIVTLTKPDGTVLTVPPAGSIVRVFRDTPEQQNVTASQLQNFTAKQLERIFDSVVAMIQEVSYSDLHKTIRLTETQRDVSMEQLKEENDQAILYWDFETRQLKATDYGQNQVVKSDTVDRLVYLQPEGKIYFIPKGSNNPIAIGSATIHNDLGGRNAPDCHPESAITGLREHLQELRDADTALAEDVQIALNRSQEAKDTADEAKATAEYAQTIAGQAKDIAEDAKETAEGIESIAQEAKDTADEAKEIAQDAKDIAEGVVEDIEAVEEGLANHIADTSNPHSVTKAQVGLGNVDNTSDLAKPISTATQTALNAKANSADLATVATSGSYNDLSDKPTIPAAQVNADWNAASGVAKILNKPTLGTAAAANATDFATAAQGSKADTAVQPSDLATVATSGSYNDLSNKPTIPTVPVTDVTVGGTSVVSSGVAVVPAIPTVNDATLTIQKNGTSVATFTANASSNVTANISVPTTTNDLTNNSGFITSSDIPVTDVTVGGTSVVSSGVAVVPAIPTVNDSTITITQGGVTKGSFTLNQASGDTIALDAGGSGGTLDSLSDVIITSATNGQVLTYNNGDWVNADSTGGYHPDLFDWKWADHQLNDVQWLRADTFSWQDGSVYEAAYDHLETDITGKTLTSETVAGVTVQFYLADDGHKICPDSQESNVASIYTATGVSWYYIIDTVNERFKLPRTKFGVTGLRDTVGKYVAPGLPDITSGGAAVMAWYNNQSTWAQGSLKKTDTTAGSMATSGNWTNTGITALRASFESSIYGNSTTVQAPATQMYLYFFVGEFTQTALENTAGLNASLFNGKADVDLSNATSNASSSAKETIVGWGLPDYSASVSKNVGTSYTATEDGVVEVYIQTNNNVRMAFTFNGVETRFATSVAGTGGFGTVYKPIKAGDTYLVSQTAGEGTYDVWLYQFTPYSY